MLRNCKYILLFLLTASLSKGVAQVNIQSGSANFSLPVFNWQDDKSRLSGAVSLNYNSGTGLKVNDMASNMGQGWALQAGGSISRLQAGEPDDQKPREGATDDITKYPPGYLYNNADISAGCPQALARYPIFQYSNTLYKQHNAVAADRELDLFAFQFMGTGGVFVLNKETGTGVALNDVKIKIWFDKNENMKYNGKGIRTVISAFYIQDENGLIYKFSQLGLTKVMKHKYCDPDGKMSRDQPSLKGQNVYFQAGFDDNELVNPYIVNTWALTEISDPLTRRKTSFTYASRFISGSSGTDIAYYKENDYSIVTYKTTQNIVPVLTGINYPDGHAVAFNFAKERVDMPGDFVMSSIDLTYKGRPISRYLLSTSYVISRRYGNPVTPAQKKAARLYLRSVKKIGPDLKAAEPPYTFDYYLGSNAPDDMVPSPFTHLKDIWGYYNGDYSRASDGRGIPIEKPLGELDHVQVRGLCYVKENTNDIRINPKPGLAQNGLLKMITYPTGGFLTYTYEQNTGIINGVETIYGGVHVSKTSVVDGGYSNNCDNPLVTTYRYKDEYGASSLWGIETPNNIFSSINHYLPEDKRLVVKFKSFIPDITCEYKYQYPGIQALDQAIRMEPPSDIMKVVNTALAIYTAYTDFMTLLHLVTGDPIGAAIQILLKWVIGLAFTCFGDPGQVNPSHIFINSDLTAANPLPIQYSRVEVIQGNGTQGKTVSDFTSAKDYPVWAASNPNQSMAQRGPSWAYGLPKLTTVYDAAGNKVKEVVFRYDITPLRLPVFNPGNSNDYPDNVESIDGEKQDVLLIKDAVSASPSCKCVVKKSTSQRNTDWSNTSQLTYTKNSDENMTVEMYDMYKGRLPLMETYERLFKPGSSTAYAETKTEYRYNSNNYQVSQVRVSQSNGDITQKDIQYNVDFYDGAALSKLTANNILNVPVTVTESVIKAGSSVVSGLVKNVTEFSQLADGNIKPIRTLSARTARPQATGWAAYYGPGVSFNSPDFAVTQVFTYDSRGNLTGMKDEGAHSVTNLYDYDDKYVTGSAINADVQTDKIAYTSFESDNWGGWTLTGGAPIISQPVITGARAITMASHNILTTTITADKAYTLSFWASAAMQVNGNATLLKSAPTINGFTYYEYKIAAGTTTVTITGNANLDELRIYPFASRLRTVTYDPVIGKTSECDENNRVRYYEYDELGRVRYIRDEHRNIVKMYEYNYLDRKQNGCSGIYYNNAITEYFTKDCSPGYEGTAVPYFIPAQKYSSTNSQEEADQLAENELSLYGQSFANSSALGACLLVYSNSALSKEFKKGNCETGYTGNTYTYTVPAGRYTSTKSQAYVDSLAAEEAMANGPSFANTSAVGCIIDRTPNLEYTGEGRCKTRKYGNTGMREIEVIDVNPNTSGVYNTKQWIDSAVNLEACPVDNNPAWEPTGKRECKLNSGYNTGAQYAEQKDMNPSSNTYGQTRMVSVGTNTTACPVQPDWVDNGPVKCQQPDGSHNNGILVQPKKDNNPVTALGTKDVELGPSTSCPVTADWQPSWDIGDQRCEQDGQRRITGYLEHLVEDRNPYSATWQQTRWARFGDRVDACPIAIEWVPTGKVQCEKKNDEFGELTGRLLIEESDQSPYRNIDRTRWADGGVSGACSMAPVWQQVNVSCEKNGAGYTNGFIMYTYEDNNPNSYTYKSQTTERRYVPGTCPDQTPVWQFWYDACQTDGGYNTGFREYVYRDVNPNSPSYNSTNSSRLYEPDASCPVLADYRVVSQGCQRGDQGYYTGYYLTTYRDMNPYSPTGGQSFSNAVYLPNSCPVEPDWQLLYTFCEKTGSTYTGYMAYVYRDVNPYSSSLGEINTNMVYDPAACHDSNPLWQEVSSYCEQSNGDITGYSVSVLQDKNPYSASYNQQTETRTWKPSVCTPPCVYNCSGVGYKCVNNVCELGVKNWVGSVWRNDAYYCVFRYYWSDGTFGPDIEELINGNTAQNICDAN